MKQVIQHDLGVATAKRATERAFAEYKGRYPDYTPTLEWRGEQKADVTFNAKGVKLNGNVDIADSTVTLELDVPFLFRPFQKKAMEVIEREVRVWLDKAKKGEI